MTLTRQAYEAIIYRIAESSEYIHYSDIVLIPAGRHLATLSGKIYFEDDIYLEIREALDFDLENWITGYGYVVYKGNKRQYWYDSQEHPDDPVLAVTHPHHKHIPPNIKRNRIPAPNLSFSKSNIPFLIDEIEKIFFAVGEV